MKDGSLLINGIRTDSLTGESRPVCLTAMLSDYYSTTFEVIWKIICLHSGPTERESFVVRDGNGMKDLHHFVAGWHACSGSTSFDKLFIPGDEMKRMFDYFDVPYNQGVENDLLS